MSAESKKGRDASEKGPDAPSSESSAPAGVQKAPVEKVFWVKFHDKSSKEQTQDVQLGVKGEFIIIQRGVRVPLLNRYVEAAKNAFKVTFEQEPNKPRMTTGSVLEYPFDTFEEATMEDWLNFKKNGTKKAQEFAERIAVK